MTNAPLYVILDDDGQVVSSDGQCAQWIWSSFAKALQAISRGDKGRYHEWRSDRRERGKSDKLSVGTFGLIDQTVLE